jgi:hypothetical protein
VAVKQEAGPVGAASVIAAHYAERRSQLARARVELIDRRRERSADKGAAGKRLGADDNDRFRSGDRAGDESYPVVNRGPDTTVIAGTRLSRD